MSTPRKRTKAADKEVAVGQSFTVGKGGVRGTPSDETRSRTGAYAASSVIQPGTAAVVAAGTVGKGGEHLCACGCGQTPRQASSLFMPGHDSKVRSMGKAVLEGRVKETQLGKTAREYLHEGKML